MTALNKIILNKAPVSLILTNSKGEIEYVNPKFAELTGYCISDVLSKDIDIFKPVDYDATLYKEFWEIITSKGKWEGEFRQRKKNGDLFWAAASVCALEDKNGKIKHLIESEFDITQRKQIEKMLKDSEAQYKVLLNTVPDLIIRTDVMGNIIFVNESLLSQQFPAIQLLGENIMSFVLPQDKTRALKNIKQRTMQKVGLIEYKLKFGKKEIDFEVNGDVLRDIDGQINGLVFVLRDVTKRKKVERELEKYRLHLEELIEERTQKLEEVNKLLEEKIFKQKFAEEKVKQALLKEREFNELRSKLTSMASHEFRTPLAVILSSVELIQRYGRKWNEKEFNEQVGRIKEYVIHMTNIIDEMLIISRTETGKIKFEPKVTDLELLCLSILADLKLLHKKEFDVKFNYQLKQNKFILDEKLLKYIIINLLSNAIKYSNNNGGIEFNINLTAKNIAFEIIDHGIGIPEKDQPRLFEPFHRGENVGYIQGTGLGMSIIKRSVEMHNGSIDFESKLNEGTKFKVKIPIIQTATYEKKNSDNRG